MNDKKKLSEIYYTKTFSINMAKDKDLFDYIKEIEKKMNIASYVRELIKSDILKNLAEITNDDVLKRLIEQAVENKLKNVNVIAKENKENENTSEIMHEDTIKQNEQSKTIELGKEDEGIKTKKTTKKISGLID